MPFRPEDPAETERNHKQDQGLTPQFEPVSLLSALAESNKQSVTVDNKSLEKTLSEFPSLDFDGIIKGLSKQLQKRIDERGSQASETKAIPHDKTEDPQTQKAKESENSRKETKEEPAADKVQAKQERETPLKTPGISRDAQGRIAEIVYPDGKSYRSFQRDSDGNLTAIVSKNDTGTNRFEKQGDKWYCNVDGIKVPMPGDIKLSEQGDVSTDWGNGTSQIDKSDGSFQTETKTPIRNSNGDTAYSITTTDSQGRILNVTLPNGSSRVFAFNDNKEVISITDSRKSSQGERVETWTRQTNPDGSLSDIFATQRPNGKTLIRESVNIKPNGDYDYRGPDGKEHTSASDFLRSASGSADVDEARSRLEEVARNHNMNLKRFTKFMDEFERRCAKGAEEKMQVPNDEAVAKTYDSLSKLLEGNGKNFLNDKQRVKVAEQAMHNIAYPNQIDQGQNPTCSITTGEIYTASRRPERYANLLEQIATTGKYTFEDAKGRDRTVKPPRSGLLPGQEESSYNLDHANENERNWASKIVQVTAVNTIEPGYTSGIPSGANIDGILKMTKNISGDKMPYTGYGNMGEPRGVKESTLIKLKESGNFPVGVMTLGGEHVQVIRDVRIENGKVKSVLLDNSWGKENDHGWISMRQLRNVQFGQMPSWGI